MVMSGKILPKVTGVQKPCRQDTFVTHRVLLVSTFVKACVTVERESHLDLVRGGVQGAVVAHKLSR
ncbi:hypothetical protein PISMIDRAFT_686074, partial [Pisolithus microcarpus 441]